MNAKISKVNSNSHFTLKCNVDYAGDYHEYVLEAW